MSESLDIYDFDEHEDDLTRKTSSGVPKRKSSRNQVSSQVKSEQSTTQKPARTKRKRPRLEHYFAEKTRDVEQTEDETREIESLQKETGSTSELLGHEPSSPIGITPVHNIESRYEPIDRPAEGAVSESISASSEDELQSPGKTTVKPSQKDQSSPRQVPMSPKIRSSTRRKTSTMKAMGMKSTPTRLIATKQTTPLTRSLGTRKSTNDYKSPTVLKDVEENDEITASAVGQSAVKTTDPGGTNSVLATPKGQRSTKKMIVGNVADVDELGALPDSPSNGPSMTASRKRSRTSQITKNDTTKRTLFKENDAPSNSLEIEASSIEILPIVSTPSKTRVAQLQLEQTPQKSPRSSPKQSPQKSSASRKRKTTAPPLLQVQAGHIALLKNHIVAKLSGKSRLPLLDREAQYSDIYSLLRETITRSESNSALILGPRSSGKRLLVETAIQSFKDDPQEFLVVRLDGLVQTDDRMALRAIARQLQPENEEIANADIMTALLAILSHPREFGETDEPLSTVIILEHFEQFTEHARQTLLYNLFDIAQSKKAPICVLGLTTRVDAYESLEKRVKSRFSHRVILTKSLSYNQFHGLALSSAQFTLKHGQRKSEGDIAFEGYTKTWNDYLETSAEFSTFTRYIYLTSLDMKEVFANLLPIMAQLGSLMEPSPFPSFATLPPHPTLSSQGKSSLLSSLSIRELSLLIAASRTELKQGRLNFSTTYDEYAQLANKTTLSQRMTGVTNSRIYSNLVCRSAWESLIELGLLHHVGGTRGSTSAEFRLVRSDVRLLEINTVVKQGYIKIPSGMNSWLSLG